MRLNQNKHLKTRAYIVIVHISTCATDSCIRDTNVASRRGQGQKFLGRLDSLETPYQLKHITLSFQYKYLSH